MKSKVERLEEQLLKEKEKEKKLEAEKIRLKELGARLKEMKKSDKPEVIDLDEYSGNEIIDTELPVVKSGSVVNKKKYSKLGFWNKRKIKRKGEISFLIRMFFSNGTSKEFVIATRHETFTYKKREYYLRFEDSVFNLTQNQYELTYLDDIAVPVARSFIKQGNQAFWSVTPENLKPLIEMNYIKTLANTGDLDKYLKMTATLVIFLVIMIIVTLFMLFSISKKVGLILGG